MLDVERSSDLGSLPPGHARALIARGEHTGGTSNMANGRVQGNLAILPKGYALDFFAFCQANPKPCPLLGVSEAGNPALPMLGDIDIRTDVPGYYIYRDGRFAEEASEIGAFWRDDFVSFILGCSYSFEEPLMEAGIGLRHVELGRVVPMYRTNIQTRPAGPFGGDLVVSMRPMKPADAIRAVQITTRFPAVHGAPVHLADPGQIGIDDLMTPDWGDPPEMRRGEIPVFWACGVTPQVAIERARPEICITHKPGHMLITDLVNASLAAI